MRPLSSTVVADLLDALIALKNTMKNTSVTPEARPSTRCRAEPQRENRRKNDARQRVGHLHIGIDIAADPGWRREPEADGDPGNRADRESEDRFPQRDRQMFQITPLLNQSTIWLPTSTGLEKKNGGSRMRPKIGTVASNCHKANATTATRI